MRARNPAVRARTRQGRETVLLDNRSDLIAIFYLQNIWCVHDVLS